MATIFEVIETGPIVFADEDYGVIITINGSYLNQWNKSHNQSYNHSYDCNECSSGHDDLYNLTVSDAMDIATAWFKEMVEKDEEDQDD